MATHLKKLELANANMFSDIFQINLVGKLRQHGIVGKTHKVDTATGKIMPVLSAGHDTSTPWVHVKQDPERDCDRYEIIERVFGFIPTLCLACWKVVVRPKTLLELFKLYNLQVGMNEKEDVACKCGIEIDRPYVHALYGGYFYCHEKESGLERYSQVRKLVDEQMGKHVPIILKRYCTEYELKYGDSKGYKQPKAAKTWEELMDKYFVSGPKSTQQPQITVADVMERWIRHAEINGDETVLMFNNGEHLFRQVRSYHKEAEVSHV